MIPTLSELAHQFPPANRDGWLALVAKTLKGGDLESLVIEGPDGLKIAPLYERWPDPRLFRPASRSGQAPWDLRTRIRYPSRYAACDALAEDLGAGATSVILALRHSGADGIDVASQEELAEVLGGAPFDVTPIALDAGFLGPIAADWLSMAVKGSPEAPLAFHLDPVGAFAREGVSEGAIEGHLATAAETAARLSVVHPKSSLFLASGQVVHEAGGGPALELAFVLASGLAYLKALTIAGLDLKAASARLVVGLAIDADPLISIAKLRAARIVWSRLADACGVPATATIETRSSVRALTCVDPWTNMVRLTAAGAAAAIGGADAIVLGAFTDALGLPIRFARRMARNTQLVLMHEAGLGMVTDPVAGSGAFETLSHDIAKVAWAQFNAIEAAGGVVAALCKGMIARQAEVGLAALRSEIAGGGMQIVGVTDFRGSETRSAPVEDAPVIHSALPGVRSQGEDSRCPPLEPIGLEGLAP